MSQTQVRESPSAAVERSPSEPAVEWEWDVARLFPPRGSWTEADYLELPSNRLVELSDGCLEVLEVADEEHQFIALALLEWLRAFLRSTALGGAVLVAPFPVRLWPGKFREPDVLYMSPEHAHRRSRQFWEAPDLVMEVVSPGMDARRRDLEVKRAEYARAGIAEYWIVDREQERVLVLALEGDGYVVHGEAGRGSEITSRVLPGFTLSVDAILDAACG